MDWELELGGTNDVACECCGNASRTVDGFLHEGGATRAGYLVHWTRGHVHDEGAHFDFIVGKWGEPSEPGDRVAVSLIYQRGSGFTVIDAGDRPVAQSELTGRALARAEVIGTDLAGKVFAMVDRVWLGDPRIAEITGAG
jgi:hypothetical protein